MSATQKNGSEGLSAWISPTDPLRLGLGHLALVVTAFLLGTGFAWMMQAELFSPGRTMIDAEVFQSLSTLHGLLLVAFCAVPALAAVFGNLLLPAFLGADALPFPRLGRLALHLHAIALVLVVFATFFGTVTGSWTFVPWLESGGGLAVALIALALHLMAFSIAFTGLGHIATVLVSGIAASRLSVFAWSMLTSGLLQVVVAPALGAASLLLFVQQLPGATVFGVTVDPLDQARLMTFFSHAAVALVMVPGIGVVAEILAHNGRRNVYAPRLVVGSTILLAALWICGWSVQLVGLGDGATAGVAASAFALLTLVPGTLLVFSGLATLNQASVRIDSAFLHAISFVVHAAMGGLAALFLNNLATGPALQSTTFAAGTLHYLLAGAGTSAFLAALYQVWPRIAGRRLDERMGMSAAGLLFAGVHFSFLPQLIMGAQGLPLRLFDSPAAFTTLQRFSTFGSWILALGLLLVAWNLLQSWMSGSAVEAGAADATPLGEV